MKYLSLTTLLSFAFGASKKLEMIERDTNFYLCFALVQEHDQWEVSMKEDEKMMEAFDEFAREFCGAAVSDDKMCKAVANYPYYQRQDRDAPELAVVYADKFPIRPQEKAGEEPRPALFKQCIDYYGHIREVIKKVVEWENENS